RPVTPSDYVAGPIVAGVDLNGVVFNQPTFILNPLGRFTGGQLLANGAAEQEYKGATLTFTKRLAHRWMLRGNVTWDEWTASVPSGFFQDANDVIGEPVDGATVAQQSPVPNKSSVFINSKWSYSVNGLYQIAPNQPWGFSVAADVYGRQGYPIPQFLTVAGADGKTRQIQIVSLYEIRLDNVTDLAFDVMKEFKRQATSFEIELGVFNALNQQRALQKVNNLSDPSKGLVTERMGPRAFRLGARINF